MTKLQLSGPPRFDHQKRGLAKILSTGGVCALLFDPGTGKTATTLDYCSILAMKSQRGEARVLVVAPLAAVDTWVMQSEVYVSPQVNVWAEALGGTIKQRAQALAARGGSFMTGTPDRGPKDSWQGPRAAHWQRSHITAIRTGPDEPDSTKRDGPDGLGTARPRLVLEVLNIDSFVSRARVGSKTMADVMAEAVRRFDPDLVVVDESHRIKSPSGNASRLLARIGEHVKRRVILTGTVMPHSPLDVFGQWRFLEPYAFGTKQPDGSIKKSTFGAFKGTYAEQGGWMGKEVVGYRNLDDMQQIMSLNSAVAKKEDALDLPPTTTVVVPVHLSAAEKQAYKDMASDLVASFGTDIVSANNRLTQMMRMRQITSGYAPTDNGPVKVIGKSKASTIRSIVKDNLAGEKRIVIFALFRHEIKLLTSMLDEAGTELQVITGGTSQDERMRMRRRFGSNDPQRMVMIAQIKTMSLAVNELVTANHAIFASLSQQRDDVIQAQDRLDRIGQTRPVTFWYALAPGTVDEIIMDSHQKRTNLESSMLSHIHKVHERGLS